MVMRILRVNLINTINFNYSLLYTMSNEIYIKEYPFNNQIVDNLQYDKY